MGLLLFIYSLITGLRPGRRLTTDGAVRELTHSQSREEFFDAASLHCGLRPVRAKISADPIKKHGCTPGRTGSAK
jgi:hypothetical protein